MNTSALQKLGDSPFNYDDYTVYRFIHYWQQIRYIQRLNPENILEIGPGDHTVTDFLRRKGISVRTLDNDARLHPDYQRDIRQDLNIEERFDLVVACEVFEHSSIKYLGKILDNLKPILLPGGHLLASVPYSTIRLFPSRSKYGHFISCEGRVHTHIPYSCVQLLRTVRRGFYRLLIKRQFTDAFEPCRIFPDYPDDKYDTHHWDVGVWPTTRSVVRKIFQSHFALLEERGYVNTNCVFYVLQKTDDSLK
jgi:SAM-dependent methyltransferase